jgi:hypothetical protein
VPLTLRLAFRQSDASFARFTLLVGSFKSCISASEKVPKGGIIKVFLEQLMLGSLEVSRGCQTKRVVDESNHSKVAGGAYAIDSDGQCAIVNNEASPQQPLKYQNSL